MKEDPIPMAVAKKTGSGRRGNVPTKRNPEGMEKHPEPGA